MRGLTPPSLRRAPRVQADLDDTFSFPVFLSDSPRLRMADHAADNVPRRNDIIRCDRELTVGKKTALAPDFTSMKRVRTESGVSDHRLAEKRYRRCVKAYSYSSQDRTMADNTNSDTSTNFFIDHRRHDEHARSLKTLRRAGSCSSFSSDGKTTTAVTSLIASSLEFKPR